MISTSRTARDQVGKEFHHGLSTMRRYFSKIANPFQHGLRPNRPGSMDRHFSLLSRHVPLNLH